MRAAETEYWDEMAHKKAKKISDNSWKRAAIAHRIYTVDWYNKRVLEIGIGFGTIAATLRIVYLDNFKYVATDVSKIFCEKAKEFFDIDVVNTDILGVPSIKDGYNRVLALDTLEHIRPKDRDAGYKRLGEVIAEDCTMFINMPFEETGHDLEFDYPFGVEDISRLCEITGLRIKSFEEYVVTLTHNDTRRRYGWAVLVRGNGG